MREKLNNRKMAAARRQRAGEPGFPFLVGPAGNKTIQIVGDGDNSNTQFAALGLWAGRHRGVSIEPAANRLAQRFRVMQKEDGGWPYMSTDVRVSPGRGSTPTMTCAGLFGFLVGSAGSAKNLNTRARGISTDPTMRKGLLALSAIIHQPQGKDLQLNEQSITGVTKGRSYYFLWALERVAVALDLKTIGKKDWYKWGVGILLKNQQADGTWQGDYAAGGVDTCFELLFLKRSNLTPDVTALMRGR